MKTNDPDENLTPEEIARREQEEDDEEDDPNDPNAVPPVAAPGAPAPTVPTVENGLAKSVQLSANDLFGAIGQYLDQRLTPVFEQLHELTKAVNAGSASIDTMHAGHIELKKSIDLSREGLPELLKSIQFEAAKEEERPAPSNAGAITPTSTTATPLNPGDALSKAGVATPNTVKDMPVVGGAIGGNSPMTDGEKAESKGVISKAMNLSESGITVDGFEEALLTVRGGKPLSSATFQKLKASVEKASTSSATSPSDNTSGW